MANLSKCKRCGGDITEFTARTTNKRFCSVDCRDTWWNEAKSKGVTRSQVAALISGPSPQYVLEDIQAAWLAGLIDGEGTISIWREKRQGNKSGYRFRAVVEIANTNLDLIEAFRSAVGGYAASKGRRPDATHRECWRATVHRRAIPYLLERITPFLVVKKRQAGLVLQFQRLVAEAPMRTAQHYELFERLWLEVRELNRRGVPQEV